MKGGGGHDRPGLPWAEPARPLRRVTVSRWRISLARAARREERGRESTEDRIARIRASLRTAAADNPAALAARQLSATCLREGYRATAPAERLARRFDPGDALPAGAARAEIYRGGESAARRVIEVVAPIVERARSWADLHRDLAAEGIVYAGKGSGAVLIVEGQAVKASICRAASFAKLKARFGPFEPGPDASAAAEPSPNDGETDGATIGSPRAAPGTDPGLYARVRHAWHEIAHARADYDAHFPQLNEMPLLKTVLVGPRPPAAPGARKLAKRGGEPLPRLAGLRRPAGRAAEPLHSLASYHAALGASRYRLVAVRPETEPTRPDGEGAKPSAMLDRIVQITPRPLTGIAAALPSFLAACRDRAIHLIPEDEGRHHVVLSDLDRPTIGRLIQRFSPSLVLARGRERFDAVLSAAKTWIPFEAAAVARASAAIRNWLGVARGRFGLVILEDPGEEVFRLFAHAVRERGGNCATFAAAIRQHATALARRFGAGLGWPQDKIDATLGEPPNAALYRLHRGDILARWEGPWPDASRVDALVARRLRIAGQSQDEVAALIAACSPAVAAARRDWQAYGARAAAHAFRDGDDGSWDFDRLPYDNLLEMLGRKMRRSDADKDAPTAPPLPSPAQVVEMAAVSVVRRPARTRSGRGIGDG